MKKQFSLGQRIDGRVEIMLSAEIMLVSFDGNLVSVENHSSGSFSEGDIVELIVDGVDPVVLKLARANELGRFSINA